MGSSMSRLPKGAVGTVWEEMEEVVEPERGSSSTSEFREIAVGMEGASGVEIYGEGLCCGRGED